ncbi:zinc ribbon domain-containing protein [Lactobacillus mulieris]|uniref:TcaA 3rd/4th domain-containing protein n=1 Tax=Lactobacillus mulieris TaxID=2508708 RepID=UPI0022AC64FD|nr:zinc ribbon domain-containing protein [Lactobacillus mulieris]MCZ3744306.1 zinc ribbon domain-containing protein [Lactobacillus mulieris]
MSIRYCFNCGHKINKADVYCTYCGANQKTRIVPNSEAERKRILLTRSDFKKVEKYRNNKGLLNKVDLSAFRQKWINFNQNHSFKQIFHYLPKNNFSKRKQRLVIGLLLGTCSVLFFAFWGMNYYSRDNQLSQITNYLENPNKKGFAAYIVSDKTGAISHNKSYKSSIKLIKNGAYWLVFPRYKLSLPTYSLTVTTNHANSKLKINNNYKSMSKQGNTYAVSLNKLIVGQYNLSTHVKLSGRDLSSTKSINLFNNQTVKMDIKTLTFTVQSLPNASVYINNKKVATLNEQGKTTINNYPITSKTKIFVSYENNDSTIDSEISSSLAHFAQKGKAVGNLQKKNGKYVYMPTWQGLASSQEAKTLLAKAFSKKITSGDFVNSTNNTDYKTLKKMFKGFNKDSKIKSYSTSVKIIKVLPLGNNESQISYEVTYKFKHKSDTRIQVMKYTNAVLYKKGNNIKIQSVGGGSIISDKTKKN